MALLRVEEGWVERVNKNLLPLLNKFSIRRQGPFGLSNVIQPVVNVETLEEAQAAAQQRAVISGTLAAVGSNLTILVTVGEVWSIEYVAMGSTSGGAGGAQRDSFEIFVGGVVANMRPEDPEAAHTTRVTTGFSHSFNPPLIMNGGEGFFLVRRVLGASTPAGMVVAFRRV